MLKRITRGITIAAPPERIWPWLMQMGYGRAGWYSYDRLDTVGESSHRILPEFQHLAVGDIVPTHPGGGFKVQSVEPFRYLVLSVDPSLMVPADEEKPVPHGLAASGRLSDLALDDFRATWAFVLEPLDAEHTRLIERFRVQVAPAKGIRRAAMSVLSLGVFAMTRRQLLGIRERAEDDPGLEPEALPAAA
jgi:hypothetical protein